MRREIRFSLNGRPASAQVAPHETVVEVLGIPTRFIPQGKPDQILASFGLDADGVVKAVRDVVP